LTREVPERRVRVPSITSLKGERSIGTVSSESVQESPDRCTPEARVPEATLRPAAQPAQPGAVSKTLSAAKKPPHHDRHARQIEPRGNVPDNKQKGEARVERPFTLGVKVK